MIGAEERWRELRAQGALIDAAARGARPQEGAWRRCEKTSAAKP